MQSQSGAWSGILIRSQQSGIVSPVLRRHVPFIVSDCVRRQKSQLLQNRADFRIATRHTKPRTAAKDVVIHDSTPGLLNELKERGLVNAITSEGLQREYEAKTNLVTYCGVDPTAPSLHLGNLLTLMPLIHMHVRGHSVIAVVGSFTASAGDPSGRSSERDPLSELTIQTNSLKIQRQLRTIFGHCNNYALTRGYLERDMGKIEILDNGNWWNSMGFKVFLEMVGMNTRVSSMLNKESVKLRLQSPEGMNLGEFLYQLLQAYDYFQLYRMRDCRLQIGGSDQWGNITAGIDLIHRLLPTLDAADYRNRSKHIYGLTIPLLTTSSGEKFGKTEGNAIWLDPELTFPFDIYQFFLRTEDDHVESYLKMFTLLPLSTIQTIMSEHRMKPELRHAQRCLAEDVVALLHGSETAQECIKQTAALFPKALDGNRTAKVPDYNADLILNSFWKGTKRTQKGLVYRERWSELRGISLTQLVKRSQLVNTTRAAERLIKCGGIHVNGAKITDAHTQMTEDNYLDGKVMVLKAGRQHFRIVYPINQDEIDEIDAMEANKKEEEKRTRKMRLREIAKKLKQAQIAMRKPGGRKTRKATQSSRTLRRKL